MTTSSRARRARIGTSAALGVGLACSLSLMGMTPAQARPAPTPTPLLASQPAAELVPGVAPLDPQDVDNLDELTWDDFNPIPNTNWADPSVQPTEKRWQAAIVLVDYPDTPFQVTEPQGSNIWGNPGPNGHDIPRDEVPEFYKDLLNTPSELNNYHTINEYWMEDTGGRYGVEITAFGPYRMPKNEYQYHYNSYGNKGSNPATKCPTVLKCTGNNFRSDALAALKAGTGLDDPLAGFDNVFYVGAGQDQSSAWLEFGQAMFKTPEDIPDEYGPPQEWKDAVKAETGLDAPNWAPTRYVDWTSWAASASLWANASGNTSIESEGDGRATYAHEFSHNLRIGDNYGNPYAANPKRDQSGPWDMMGRGSFNGPGGPHQRYHAPLELGDQMGSQHMLRDKMLINIVSPDAVVNVNRSDLATDGVAVTSVTAREVQLPGQTSGINVVMDGDGDRSTCESQGAAGDLSWMCDGLGYKNYTLEVVDQMGQDSYTPDSGVLLAKTDRRGTDKWVIDANPQDIDLIDYYMADGTPVKLTRGDHRQLNDALFKAGTGSGSQFEYVDEANGLHFYVLGQHRDADGILSYDLAVRSTDGAGTQTRGVALGTPTVSGQTPGQVASCTVPLTNTGQAGGDALHSSDVYRIAAAADGAGWDAVLPTEIVAAEAGQSTAVTVYAVRGAGAGNGAALTVTATSESDPSKTATASCAVTAADTATPGTGVQVITASLSGASLTMTVPDNQPVVMDPVALTGADQVTSGALNPVGVTDARGTSAGWDLTGQVSDFTSEAGTILADNLGWRPAADLVTGALPSAPDQASTVSAGPVAQPGSGLGTARALCTSPVDHSAGSFTCSGGLDLGVPGSARLGTYTGVLTLTLI